MYICMYALVLLICNSGDISIYRDMEFHIVIYEVLSVIIISILLINSCVMFSSALYVMMLSLNTKFAA